MNALVLVSVPPQIVALAAAIRELTGDDDLAFTDTLDGETDVIRAAREAVRTIGAMEAMSGAAAQLADRYGARSKDFNDRAARARSALANFMSEIAAPKLILPEGTVSLAAGSPAMTGNPDADLLPDNLVRIKREPDRTAIKKALQSGVEVPGCALTNSPPKLMIRTR